MTTYWAMYLLPAMAALAPFRAARTMRLLGWWTIGITFTLIIGFRYEVGGDWTGYLDFLAAGAEAGFEDYVFLTDPGYAVINWLLARSEAGIYGVNLVCGAIFMIGIVRFCQVQPLPWVAFCISVPYLVVVVAMGYSRQAVALGFLLWALAELQNLRQARFVILILAAALFHKTAVALMPLAFFVPQVPRLARSIGVSLLFAASASFLFIEHYESLWTEYVETGMHSEGGAIRVWMNLVPALLFLAFWKRWNEHFDDQWLWKWFALLSIVCVPLVAEASTAVDRTSLYFTPIQIVVWSRLPILLRMPLLRSSALVLVLGTYGLVMWVWLNFAIHAPAWVPYKNALFL
jgi:hypothetical protein